MTTRTAKTRLNESIATRERWQAEDEAARLNLAELESRPVDLSDVERAFTLAAERAAARERVAICAGALVEARAAELQARRSAVVAEADALAPVIATARKALDDFNARTEELLAPLVAHTGREWREVDPFRDARESGATGALRFAARRSEPLTSNLTRLTMMERALRLAAAGGDPTTVLPVEELPECLREGGVLPYSAVTADGIKC